MFDPQRLAPGIPSATRWSPIRGCQDPQTALVCARALTTRVAAGTTDANFWQSSAEQAVRCLLHAAALADLTSADLYRWSLADPRVLDTVSRAPGEQFDPDTFLRTGGTIYLLCTSAGAAATARPGRRVRRRRPRSRLTPGRQRDAGAVNNAGSPCTPAHEDSSHGSNSSRLRAHRRR